MNTQDGDPPRREALAAMRHEEVVMPKAGVRGTECPVAEPLVIWASAKFRGSCGFLV